MTKVQYFALLLLAFAIDREVRDGDSIRMSPGTEGCAP